MAGDWIKMRADLFTHPKVVRISSALKADTLRTVGGLMSVWCLFDAHSEDGRLSGYEPQTLDDHLRWPGFAAAMQAVQWLVVVDGEGLELPRFDSHNGHSAKRRAQEADRKRDARKASASEADTKRTREEKRREEAKAPQPPEGAGFELTATKPKAAKASITLATYLADCEAQGEEAIPESDAVWVSAAAAGLPREFIPLAWWAFQGRYLGGKTRQASGAGWVQKFRNAVRENWFKLWWINGETYQLTTTGMQVKREMEASA